MFRIVMVLGWLRENWGSMSTLIVGLLAILLAVFPSTVAGLEKKSVWRILFPFIVGVIAITGFISSQSSETALRGQIDTLYRNSTGEATKSDLTNLTSAMNRGFDRIVNAIASSSEKRRAATVTAKPKAEIPAPPLPAPPHITFTQARGVSTDPAFKFALQVTVQSDQQVPVAFGIECTGNVGKVTAFLVGQAVYFNTLFGQRGNEAIVKFSYPALNPQAPLVVTILSTEDIRVKGINAL